MSFDRIEQLAAAYEWQRRSLYSLLEQLERKISEAKATALPSIKAQVGETIETRIEDGWEHVTVSLDTRKLRLRRAMRIFLAIYYATLVLALSAVAIVLGRSLAL